MFLGKGGSSTLRVAGDGRSRRVKLMPLAVGPEFESHDCGHVLRPYARPEVAPHKLVPVRGTVECANKLVQGNPVLATLPIRLDHAATR